MEIQTKFDVNHDAFILCNNVIYEVHIIYVDISVKKQEFYTTSTSITYTISNNPAGSQFTKRFLEDELFETKEELAKSLIEKSK
jgi:hypothetical protein